MAQGSGRKREGEKISKQLPVFAKERLANSFVFLFSRTVERPLCIEIKFNFAATARASYTSIYIYI